MGYYEVEWNLREVEPDVKYSDMRTETLGLLSDTANNTIATNTRRPGVTNKANYPNKQTLDYFLSIASVRKHSMIPLHHVYTELQL